VLKQAERRLDLHPTVAWSRRGSLLILAIALGVRLAIVFVTQSYLQVEHTEVVRVATSLARQGTFANAYGPNTGATAHVSPFYPILLSLIFRGLGTGVVGEIAQEILSCLLASLTYAALPALGAACGLDPAVGTMAGMLGALLPVNSWAETKGSFEAPLVGLMLVLFCVLLARCWRSADFSLASALVTGLVSGLALLASPSLAPVVVASLLVGYWLIGRTTARQYFQFAAIVIAASILCLTPWTIRNYLVLGAPVWSRSNFGNELFISNSDMAAANMRDNLDSGWFQTAHPFYSRIERKKLRAMGEVPYNRARTKEATRWIIAHPEHFSRLTAQRIFYFWFPRMVRRPQTILMAMFSVGGLAGLIWMFRAGYPVAWLFLATFTTYPLVYYVVQSFPRYRCPVDWMLIFLTAFGICSVWTAAVSSRESGLASASDRVQIQSRNNYKRVCSPGQMP